MGGLRGLLYMVMFTRQRGFIIVPAVELVTRLFVNIATCFSFVMMTSRTPRILSRFVCKHDLDDFVIVPDR